MILGNGPFHYWVELHSEWANNFQYRKRPLLSNHPTASRSVSFASTATKPPPTLSPQLPSASKIDDLCSMLANDEVGSSSVGYLANEKFQHHIFIPKQQQITYNDLPVRSLHQIISGGSSQPLKITNKDRYELALLLSSTLLQLYNTPWLNDNWTREDIHLRQDWLGKSLAKNLYVSKTFNAVQPGCSQQSDPDLCLIQNISVFNLGIALLELAFGHSIEYYETAADLRDGVRTNLTNLYIAIRPAEETEMHEGKRYSDVVKRCIRCQFNTIETSFENDEFRENFYQGVVVTLEGILNDFVR